MKASLALSLVSLLPLAFALDANPIGKVIEMLSGEEQNIIKDGEASQKIYEKYAEFVEDTSRQSHHDIKTGKASIAELDATIEEQTAKASALDTKIEELSSALASDEGELAKARKNRKDEHAQFAKEEAELVQVIDQLSRAHGIIEREMSKTGAASMLQTQLKNANSVTDALGLIVQASMISSADGDKLSSFVQTSDSDEDAGAPAAAVYKSQSGGILDTLESLQGKAEDQLATLRKEEATNVHNFEMLEQSLEDSIKFGNKDMSTAKSDLAAAQEAKATAEGDLSVTQKAFNEDTKALSDLHREAMAKAQDFEAEVKSRGEELKALATAKKIIKEATGGATDLSYSFIQVSSSAPLEAVRIVRELGRRENSPLLTQLSMRMSAQMHDAAGNMGPFDKIIGLINDMIAKLQKEANEDATKKAYCDKELSESNAKKAEKEALVEKLSTKIDSMNARSAKLKQQVADLQKSLAGLASAQLEMNNVREEENALYKTSRADLEQGVEGVKAALKVLREYYGKKDKAHAAKEGAGSSIIGLLEVCESDFSKGLAETISVEEAAAAAYDKQTKENEIEKTTKSQDVKYKQKESTQLDKSATDEASDRAAEQQELDAVNEYLAQLKEECVAKPETYAERKRRREEEIAGLKEALSILSNDASFVQKSSRRSFRGSVLKPGM